MRKPPPLGDGQTIGVIAPAAATDALVVESGIRNLRQLGYQVRVGESVFKKAGYLAGTDRERLDDLLAMLIDPDVRVLLCARGGYGAGRLLPALAAELPDFAPKILVGYSDLTFLLTYLNQRCGLVTFHGPMVSDFESHPSALPQLLSLLTGDRSGWSMSGHTVVEPGTAEGVLTGGCLSAVVAALGTPYEIETAGKILFLEDVNEKPFRIDRMLTQMRQAGKFDEVIGVMFGEMTGCSADAYESVRVADVISDHLGGAGVPVTIGVPSGHGEGCATLPLGIRVQLAGQNVTFLESPLSD